MRSVLFAGVLLLAAAWARAQAGPAAPVSPPKPSTRETVTVTADRGLAGITDSAASVAVLTRAQLTAVPALALDDRLRQVAGFQLFRRTSSWTANPTSQGVSLRGLGSTAASRSLVVSDQVPLNDPFGGWIHWNEIPELAIQQVQLLRGGAADLYGSSAIGGVVDVVPVTATRSLQFAASLLGATENSSLLDGLVSGGARRSSALFAATRLGTGGYVPIAPSARGLVDVPSNVTADSARTELRSKLTPRTQAFLRGNVLSESRSNGTLLQGNGTRLWRYAAGADTTGKATQAAVRIFGAREAYRQSFSSVPTPPTPRNTETLTRLQRVPTNELGLVLQGSRVLPGSVTAALGFDIRDIRATDGETSVSNNVAGVTTSTSARQRAIGGYADAIWQPRAWSLSGSIRVDSFRTFDARTLASNTSVITAQPSVAELVASPRIGLVRKLPGGLALTATAFRAFRGPTMNELYRTGQVGSQTTLANSSLLAERATGFELGGEEQTRSGRLRATYFWTEVNRPISAVLLTQTPSGAQILQRQNLGQIRSRGLMAEAQSTPRHGFDAALSYQLAVATVTRFNTSSPVQTNLLGHWIPQVPRQAFTASLNYSAPRFATAHLFATYTGQQFDDAESQYALHPYARFDLSAERALGRGFTLFAAAQNLLNRSIDAGRTPTLTLAAPRLVQGGLRYNFRR